MVDSASEQPARRVRIEAAGTDLDEAVHLFETAYDGASWDASVSDLPFSFRQSAIGDENMTLRSNQFLGHVAGEMEPAEDYVLFWFASGTGVFDTTRSAQEILPGEPIMFPTDRPTSFRTSDVEQKLVHFHKPFLERIAAEHHNASPGVLHLDTTRAPSEAATRSWRNTLALVSRIITDPAASPMLQTEMSRIAAIAALGLFPPVTVDVPLPLLSPGNTRIRVAVEYIHSNCHLPISTTMIAGAADVSLRALQEGFQRLLGETPNGYLRNVRLDRVRQELQAGASGTIADTAKAWGFAHPGRFTAAYTARFGEHPSHTR